MRKIAVFGAGKIAETVYYDTLESDSNVEVICFVVDDIGNSRNDINGVPIYAWEQFLSRRTVSEAFVAIGYQNINKTRENLCKRVRAAGISLVNIVPRSRAGIMLEGENIFIMSSAMIQAPVTIQENSMVFGGANICHHVSIGQNVWITAGCTILGGVTIEDNVFVAGGAVILPNSHVGKEALLGSGTLIGGKVPECAVITREQDKVHRLNSTQYFNLFGGGI